MRTFPREISLYEHCPWERPALPLELAIVRDISHPDVPRYGMVGCMFLMHLELRSSAIILKFGFAVFGHLYRPIWAEATKVTE